MCPKQRRESGGRLGTGGGARRKMPMVFVSVERERAIDVERAIDDAALSFSFAFFENNAVPRRASRRGPPAPGACRRRRGCFVVCVGGRDREREGGVSAKRKEKERESKNLRSQRPRDQNSRNQEFYSQLAVIVDVQLLLAPRGGVRDVELLVCW